MTSLDEAREHTMETGQKLLQHVYAAALVIVGVIALAVGIYKLPIARFAPAPQAFGIIALSIVGVVVIILGIVNVVKLQKR